MMLAALDTVFEFAPLGGAVGAFTCYDTTTAIAAVSEAQRRSVPVILLVSVASAKEESGQLLIGALGAIAERASVPVCVQLDHAQDLETIERALGAGVSAVMVDGSRLAFAENAELTRAAVGLARTHAAGVEAELGHVAGGEDVAVETAVGSMTDPGQAAEFVAATGVDCLAISVGNVHGTYASPPQLDIERIEAIRQAVPAPLALHGASGVPDEQVRRSVSSGIRKVNVNTEMRMRIFAELTAAGRYADGYRQLELNAALREAVEDVVGQKLTLLGAVGGAVR
jgi:ketose-bisphosphate aldolase